MERIENFVDIFQLNREQESDFSTFVSEVRRAFRELPPNFVTDWRAFFVTLTPPQYKYHPIERIMEDKSFKCSIGWLVFYRKIEVYDKRRSGQIMFILQKSLPKYSVVHYQNLKKSELEKKLSNSEKEPKFRRLRSLRGAIQFLETWRKNNKNETLSEFCLSPVPLTPESSVWYYILNEKLYNENKSLASLQGSIDESLQSSIDESLQSSIDESLSSLFPVLKL